MTLDGGGLWVAGSVLGPRNRCLLLCVFSARFEHPVGNREAAGIAAKENLKCREWVRAVVCGGRPGATAALRGRGVQDFQNTIFKWQPAGRYVATG